MPITLFDNVSDCCGCGACADVCQKSAIKMTEGASGFLYPEIDSEACVECGLCRRVCAFQNGVELNKPICAWAATAVSEDILKSSSSGGIAAVLSEAVVKSGGTVYGVKMCEDGGGFFPAHVRADSLEDLRPIRGSKYAQSRTEGIYKKVREDLDAGRKVLFSGTPCQTAALKSYLGGDRSGLYTLDLICHGVPSVKMMRELIGFTEKESGGKTESVNFRGKSKGQGVMCAFEMKMPDGSRKTVIKNGRTLPYFAAFLKGLISRESCYNCKYARLERAADITVGDFWGFHEEYPDAVRKYGLSNKNGVSCVLITTEKGAELFESCRGSLKVMPAEAEKAARHNDQLRAPSRKRAERELLEKAYIGGGYGGFDREYKKLFRADRIKESVIACVPKGIRRGVKSMLGRLRGRGRGGSV